MDTAADFYRTLAFAAIVLVIVGLIAAFKLHTPENWATANWNAAHNECVDFYDRPLSECPTPPPNAADLETN